MRDHARNSGFHSNKELMQYLKDTGHIRSNFIFDIMCSVDRKNFTTNDCTAYRDRPEVVAYGKTISAPHMHAEVLEYMSENLRDGKYALDIGSGSGYLTTCMALALGKKGSVIGIDCIPGFQNMANKITKTHYSELIENNRVEFIVWDGRRGWPWSGPYDVIHVGVAAADIPETIIEQLAPGGCLIMPVGLEGDQVLILLKKLLNGNIQKKELMKVSYGTFIDVDLPRPSKVENRSTLSLEAESKNMLPKPPRKPQCNDTTLNRPLSKKNIEKTIEDQTDKIAESKKVYSVTTKLEINLINDSFWKSLEDMSSVKKPIKTSQSSIIGSTTNHTKDGKAVHEKNGMFEKKIEHCQKHKSPNDDTALESIPTETVMSGSKNPKQSIHEHEENSDESLDQHRVNESLNTTNELFPNPLKENVENELILKLHCKIPKINESEKNIPTISEKIDIFEKINYNLKVSKSQENITEKIESDFDDSDETHSVDTEIDTQDIHEECKNNDKTFTNTQLNQKTHYINKSFSKSLENFSTTNEPVSYLKSSTSTIIASDKNKTQSVRDKIEFFEENFGNYKTPYSRKEVTRKMKITSKESDNVIGEHSKILDEKSKNINDVLKYQAENIQVRELYGTKKTITKSLENLTKTYGPVSTIQPKSSKIFKSDKTESQNVQQMTNTVKENKENSVWNIEKLNCIEKDLHQNFGEVCKKMEEQDKSRNLMSSELEIFKDEIRIILNNFLKNEKENSDKSDLREINVNINRVRQIQFVNNNSIDDSEQEYNGENLEQTEKIYKNLDDKEHHLKSSESKLELQNVYELVEKLQTQYDKNIEKNIAMNEEFQRRIVHCENLEKRLQKLEQRYHLLIKILAKIFKKIKCHEKVLNIHLTVAEKEEANRVFEKQKRKKAEEKLDKITGIISRINEETKVIKSDFLDNTTKDEDAHLLKESELMSNTPFSNSESFLPELNLIKKLLYLGKDDPTLENDSSLDDRIESTDNEIEMSLLKLILEE